MATSGNDVEGGATLRTIACVFALLAGSLTGACSRAPEPAPGASPAPAAASPSPEARTGAAASSVSAGSVAGKVAASGIAVVVLEPKVAREFPPQTEKPVMDQVGLTFGPELLIVRTGEPVEFRNNDDTLHNVNVKHEESREQAFNVAIPTDGTYVHTFRKDGFYRVGCDIHPAMAAAIFSAPTPFAVVADSDGGFGFTNVPVGAWTVTVYTGGKQLRKEIEVKGGVTNVTVE